MPKKEYEKVRYSLKAQRVYKEVVENGVTITEGMRRAGYAPSTVNVPKDLTGTKTWKQLIKKYLNEEELAKKHEELLNQTQFAYFVFPKSLSDEEITEKVSAVGVEVVVIRESDKGKYAFYKTIDAQARKAALDMAYKLRGSYAPEKSVNVNMEVEPTEDVKELTKKLNDLHRGTSIKSDGGSTSSMGEEVRDQE